VPSKADLKSRIPRLVRASVKNGLRSRILSAISCPYPGIANLFPGTTKATFLSLVNPLLRPPRIPAAAEPCSISAFHAKTARAGEYRGDADGVFFLISRALAVSNAIGESTQTPRTPARGAVLAVYQSSSHRLERLSKSSRPLETSELFHDFRSKPKSETARPSQIFTRICRTNQSLTITSTLPKTDPRLRRFRTKCPVASSSVRVYTRFQLVPLISSSPTRGNPNAGLLLPMSRGNKTSPIHQPTGPGARVSTPRWRRLRASTETPPLRAEKAAQERKRTRSTDQRSEAKTCTLTCARISALTHPVGLRLAPPCASPPRGDLAVLRVLCRRRSFRV